MHLAKCDWVKIPTTNTLVVAHHELGSMDFSSAPAAHIERWLPYTASQSLLEDFRARAEGETTGFARKDAKGIPSGFVPDLAVDRLLLNNIVGAKLSEGIPHLEGQLDPIIHRRLEVIETGAIRTQARLASANINIHRERLLKGFAHTAHWAEKKPLTTYFGTSHIAQTFEH